MIKWEKEIYKVIFRSLNKRKENQSEKKQKEKQISDLTRLSIIVKAHCKYILAQLIYNKTS